MRYRNAEAWVKFKERVIQIHAEAQDNLRTMFKEGLADKSAEFDNSVRITGEVWPLHFLQATSHVMMYVRSRTNSSLSVYALRWL